MAALITDDSQALFVDAEGCGIQNLLRGNGFLALLRVVPALTDLATQHARYFTFVVSTLLVSPSERDFNE